MNAPSFSNRLNHKPVSVLFCHLSSRPTPRKRTGHSFVLADSPVYMVFLVLVPSPSYVTIQRRELLPRGFTLTFSGGLFSVTAFIRLLPSVLSTAGCPCQSGLSSENIQRQIVQPIYLKELFFITELALDLIILSIDLCYCLFERWSNVLATLMALH